MDEPAYNDQLGLVYLPLGNKTPDYFGMGRHPESERYHSSLVALDVETGREKWYFQTVHHDIWDYDLSSQPALVDLPDEHGGTVPAILQTTKRGQLILFNRATGLPLSEVVEKAVPQAGAAPEEKLSPTQPYSHQDNTFRAYDAWSGEELWHYALPVGSSATPMSYVSPKTGRQYVLLSVGGAAHATPTSDLVMAFALPTH